MAALSRNLTTLVCTVSPRVTKIRGLLWMDELPCRPVANTMQEPGNSKTVWKGPRRDHMVVF